MADRLINSDPKLDDIQRQAEVSSKTEEEVFAVSATPDSSTTPSSSSLSSPSARVKPEPSVQDVVRRVLNDDRKKQGQSPLPRQEPSNDDPNANSLSQDVDAVLDPNAPQDSQPELDADAVVKDEAPEGETGEPGDTEHPDETEETEEDRAARVERERQEAEEAAARDANAAADAKLTQEERDAKLPFHTHPRFVELTSQNKALREKQSLIDKDIAWRQENGVDPLTYSTALQLAALSKKDPARFYQVVTQMKDEYEVSTGQRLPADLQKKVDDGRLDAADAKEIAGLRVKATGGERAIKSHAQQAEEVRISQVQQGLNSIGALLAKNDPTFRPKAGPNAKDSIWEYSLQAFTLLQASNPAKDGVMAQQQFQSCYEKVKGDFGAQLPARRPANRQINRSSASKGITPSATPRESQDARDTVSAMLRKKYGIGLSPRASSNGE